SGPSLTGSAADAVTAANTMTLSRGQVRGRIGGSLPKGGWQETDAFRLVRSAGWGRHSVSRGPGANERSWRALMENACSIYRKDDAQGVRRIFCGGRARAVAGHRLRWSDEQVPLRRPGGSVNRLLLAHAGPVGGRALPPTTVAAPDPVSLFPL